MQSPCAPSLPSLMPLILWEPDSKALILSQRDLKSHSYRIIQRFDLSAPRDLHQTPFAKTTQYGDELGLTGNGNILMIDKGPGYSYGQSVRFARIDPAPPGRLIAEWIVQPPHGGQVVWMALKPGGEGLAWLIYER